MIITQHSITDLILRTDLKTLVEVHRLHCDFQAQKTLVYFIYLGYLSTWSTVLVPNPDQEWYINKLYARIMYYIYLFYLFIQSALFTDQCALMRYTR